MSSQRLMTYWTGCYDVPMYDCKSNDHDWISKIIAVFLLTYNYMSTLIRNIKTFTDCFFAQDFKCAKYYDECTSEMDLMFSNCVDVFVNYLKKCIANYGCNNDLV